MLEVLDTAGQGQSISKVWLFLCFLLTHVVPMLLALLAQTEEYTALRDQWIREGEGFLLVYSIISRQTFERVERFRNQIS